MQDEQPTFHKPLITVMAPGQPLHRGELGVMATGCPNAACLEPNCGTVSLLLFNTSSSIDVKLTPEMAEELGNRLIQAAATLEAPPASKRN